MRQSGALPRNALQLDAPQRPFSFAIWHWLERNAKVWDEARLPSFGSGPHALAVVEGRQSRMIRRYEDGRQVCRLPGGWHRQRSFPSW